MTGLQRGGSIINRKSGLKWGGDADFLPSLKVERTPSLGRHQKGHLAPSILRINKKFTDCDAGDKSKKRVFIYEPSKKDEK